MKHMTKAEFTTMLENIKKFNTKYPEAMKRAYFLETGSQSDFNITVSTSGVIIVMCEYFDIYSTYPTVEECVEDTFRYEESGTLESWYLDEKKSRL